MSSGIELERAVSALLDIFQEVKKSRPSGFNTQAKVLRIDDDGTAWVHLDGGVDETPVQVTTSAKKGDVVQVHVEGGRAWTIGNITAPPTDDTKAINAENKALEADKHATEAMNSAKTAKEAANQAVSDASTAQAAAAAAQS